jgi:hypothetical protein
MNTLEKLKFFDQTFRMLLYLVICLWGLFILLVVFVGESQRCADSASWLVSSAAWLAGVSSAPPLIYGLVRFLFWPNSPKKGGWIKVGGLILCIGAGLFVTGVILLAQAISHYGCR